MTAIRVNKPAAILLDIEGTMTDISFVSKVLFPFIRANVAPYFEETFDRIETQELIQRMRESRNTATEADLAKCKWFVRFLFLLKTNALIAFWLKQCQESKDQIHLDEKLYEAWLNMRWLTFASSVAFPRSNNCKFWYGCGATRKEPFKVTFTTKWLLRCITGGIKTKWSSTCLALAWSLLSNCSCVAPTAETACR